MAMESRIPDFLNLLRKRLKRLPKNLDASATPKRELKHLEELENRLGQLGKFKAR
jgi:hypothetical protein